MFGGIQPSLLGHCPSMSIYNMSPPFRDMYSFTMHRNQLGKNKQADNGNNSSESMAHHCRR